MWCLQICQCNAQCITEATKVATKVLKLSQLSSRSSMYTVMEQIGSWYAVECIAAIAKVNKKGSEHTRVIGECCKIELDMDHLHTVNHYKWLLCCALDSYKWSELDATSLYAKRVYQCDQKETSQVVHHPLYLSHKQFVMATKNFSNFSNILILYLKILTCPWMPVISVQKLIQTCFYRKQVLESPGAFDAG